MNFFPSRMGLGVDVAAPASSWTPEDLFQSSELGDWIDYTDTSKLFQLVAGTTAVASSGDRIGYAAGVNGNNSLAGADTNIRPTFVTGGGALMSDAESRYHRIDVSAFSAGGDIWSAVVFSAPSGDDASTDRILTFSINANGSGDTFPSSGTALTLYRGSGSNIASYQGAWLNETSFAFDDSKQSVVTAWDYSAGTTVLTLDGSDSPSTAYTKNAAFSPRYLHVGGAPGIASRYSNATIYEYIIRNEIPSGSEIAELEGYWATKYGISFA